MWLIIINIAVFVIDIPLSNIDLIKNSYGDVITDLFGLNSQNLFAYGYAWQLVTYMFVHSSVLHLFFNMFGLLIFGPKIEYTMGKRKFLTFYLICGVGSALFYMLVTGISNIPMVGASGAIFGVLTAYGVMYPKDIIYVQFFLPMPAIVFVIVYGLSQLIFGFASLLAPQLGGIAYFGHVGGLVTGLILVKFFGFNRKKVRYYWE
jgi:membrane associated rhomboid family serine protease